MYTNKKIAFFCETFLLHTMGYSLMMLCTPVEEQSGHFDTPNNQ
jgi:hypothetical protein